MNRNKRYINLRLFFIGFLGIVCGILSFFHIFNLILIDKISVWLFIFILLFISSVGFFICCCFSKKLKKYMRYFLVFCILFVVGGSIFSFKFNEWNEYPKYEGESIITGTVNSCSYKNNYYFISLKNVNINGVDTKGDMSIYVILDDGDLNLSSGDKIETYGVVNLEPLVSEKINISRYVENKVYSSHVTASSINVVSKNSNIIYSLQEKLKNTLNRGLNDENSKIAYGILVGDKSELDDNIKNTFSYAGISHLLAVSGLHVGFLVAIITFLLNLMRVGRKNRFVITSVILILYSIFCNMSPSILRASFMAIMLLLSGVLGEEYDGLNSLGFSGILILLLFPQDLFSLGFQLSFICVFMIITLADKMIKWLNSYKILPKSIISTFCSSLCITLGTSIVIINTMSEISLISIISNVIVIPIFSITYPLLFLFAIICMIIPAFNFLLFIPQILLHITKLFANFFAGLGFAQFNVFRLGYSLLLLILILSFIIKYLMVDFKIKTAISILLSCICVAIFIVGNQPKKYKDLAVYTNYQYNTSSVVITTDKNRKYLIGYDRYSTTKLLNDLKIDEVDAIILQDFEVNRIDEYVKFVKVVKVRNFVIPNDDRYNDNLFRKLNVYTSVSFSEDFDDFNLKFIKSDNLICGTYVEIENNRLLFPNGVSKIKLNTISDEINYVDYVFINYSKYDFKEFDINYKTIVHSNELEFDTNDEISLKDKSNYVIKLNCEDII